MKKVAVFILSSILCFSVFCFPIEADAAGVRDLSVEEAIAENLKSLGLFEGVSDTDFDLGRRPSRAEAIVMLVRLLGKEEEAAKGSWKHPFTDVPFWADSYIGYAYEHKLTEGISSTQFGTGDASASMYLTFVLRALGYSDANGADFTWNDPYTLADEIGILPARVNVKEFWRADVVLVSYAALPAKIKGFSQTLADKLIAAKVFTQAEYGSYFDPDLLTMSGQYPDSRKPLTSQGIYAKCSSAVFYIETCDVEGNPYASGSGFFVDESGIAVTNHHVLENALSAKIMLTNGKIYDVAGVYIFNDELDYAVIKIDGTGFDCLPLGNSDQISGGEKIYAIGNPEGLINTISEGIVSNPKRTDFRDMIQFTAPISPGSSGGALINEYGEVIGIPTAYLASGQNLNFAVPANQIAPGEDLSALDQNFELISFQEYAEWNAQLEVGKLPLPYENNFYEAEPNDTEEYADEIESGMTVWGTIDDEYMDCFLVRCNTSGTIHAYLISESENRFVQDLIFAVEPYQNSTTSGAESQLVYLDDGSVGRTLRYRIPRAGYYMIYVLSEYLYQSYDLNTDYVFYYKFEPDA